MQGSNSAEIGFPFLGTSLVGGGCFDLVGGGAGDSRVLGGAEKVEEEGVSRERVEWVMYIERWILVKL